METLVAISILLIGISAAFSAAQSSLSATSAIKDRLTAVFLAQEAMEMVRNQKDQNLLMQNKPDGSDSNPFWLNGLLQSDACAIKTSGGSDYLCDYNFDFGGGLSFINCSNTDNGDCTLRVDTIGHYTHKGILDPGGGDIPFVTSVSKFSRTISLTEITSGPIRREVLVTVTVYWSDHGTEKSFAVTDSLFNWFAP